MYIYVVVYKYVHICVLNVHLKMLKIWRYAADGSQTNYCTTFLWCLFVCIPCTYPRVSISRNLRYEAAFDAYTQLGKGLATSGLMVGQEVCRVTHCS